MVRHIALAGAILAGMTGVCQAASPFDGHWEGEAPYAEGCAVWKSHFDIRDGAVSGDVVGQLNGIPAVGTVISGTVNADGTATIVWGRQHHFEGSFRFSGDSMAGNITSACGPRLMAGKRIIADQQPQSASAPFDGDYIGTMSFVRGETKCTTSPFEKAIRVENGKWVLAYNDSGTVIGTINSDGSTTGSGTSPSNGFTLTGRISGSNFTAQVSSSYCTYSLQLKKQ